MRWRTLPVGVRIGIGAVVVVVTVNLVIGALDAATRGADLSGTDSDPASTAPDGIAAWVELLDRNGVDTELVGETDLALGSTANRTIVALGSDELAPAEARRLEEFVTAGGRLVAGTEVGPALVRSLVDLLPVWSPAGTERAEAVGSAPEIDGIEEVHAEGVGSWSDVGTSRALLEGESRVVASVASVGAGSVVFLADPSIVQNAFLGEADNAGFALQIVGEAATTVFVLPSDGGATGLAAVPDRWKLALVGLIVAFLVGAVAAGRRIGPPDPQTPPRQPPRRAFVDAIGLALERTRRPETALEPLRARARAQLTQRVGLPVDASDEELRSAAARLGWSTEEVSVVLEPVTRDRVVAAGTALARSSPLQADELSRANPQPERKRVHR